MSFILLRNISTHHCLKFDHLAQLSHPVYSPTLYFFSLNSMFILHRTLPIYAFNLHTKFYSSHYISNYLLLTSATLLPRPLNFILTPGFIARLLKPRRTRLKPPLTTSLDPFLLNLLTLELCSTETLTSYSASSSFH